MRVSANLVAVTRERVAMMHALLAIAFLTLAVAVGSGVSHTAHAYVQA